MTLDARSGQILAEDPLSGAPDVVFLDRVNRRLYIAVGDPGTIDVFDARAMEKLGSVATEKGAQLAPQGDHLYAFLRAPIAPQIYRAASEAQRGA